MEPRIIVPKIGGGPEGGPAVLGGQPGARLCPEPSPWGVLSCRTALAQPRVSLSRPESDGRSFMTTSGRCSHLCSIPVNDRLGIESSGEMEPVQHQSEGLACSHMEAEEAPLQAAGRLKTWGAHAARGLQGRLLEKSLLLSRGQSLSPIWAFT